MSDHHAVILTKSAKNADINALLAGEREILKLIAERTLCAVSNSHIYEETAAVIFCGGREFTVKRKSVISDGWRAYLKSDETEDMSIELTEGQILNKKTISVTEGKTTPPKRFTEDTILAAMENAGKEDIPENAERKGLGTPATRAGIIEKLVSVGFAVRKKGQKSVFIVPDGIGASLITVLPEELQSPILTAEWERQLLLIEKGELSAEEFMSAIEDMVKNLVRDYEAMDGAEILFPSGRAVVGKCPRCGSDVTESKKGFFCEKNDCRFALWKDNRFLSTKKVGLTKKTVEAMLRDGKAYVSGIYSEKTGKKYDAFIVMNDDGVKTSFSLDFDKKTVREGFKWLKQIRRNDGTKEKQ